MRRVVVIDVVGLTPALLPHAPHLARLAGEGFAAPLSPVFPAVTCPVQATLLTGAPPARHGVVGNGWYFRDLAEVWFWRQSNRLVLGDKVWDEARARDPSFTCAYLFWWHAMHAACDLVVTPRPAYPADGRKIPDVWTEPPELRDELNARLGPFPLFDFWGPRAGSRSSAWIAEAALCVLDAAAPALTLVYLPHLDYCLQRLGPHDERIAQEVRGVDALAGRIIEQARACGAEVVVLSEYGMSAVSGAVHVNRVLREHGYLRARDTLVGELLDCGGSRAFAVADHQAAHVYVRDAQDVEEVARLLARTEGVERVLGAVEKRALGLDHERAGELVAVAAKDRWFTYYYWQDDARAPDFARTVDIHRKPGYDPVELFLDPAIRLPRLKVAGKLLRKALGFRCLLDVIPLDASLVQGSHGRLPDSDEEGPLLLCSKAALACERVRAQDVRALLLRLLFDS
ncbi:MAG: alkaline phosphatase family protein [Planctomycetes bacterium]|nr:alkaline phosphatase family protein [Planctomycetota bacterium]